MGDRELLELAAKAAGVKVNAARQAKRDAGGFGYLGLWTITATNWNPLTDDGDALRLAVKMSLKIEHHEDCVVVWHDYCGTGYIPYNGDPCQATRRAIVLAAVEIGEDMAMETSA